MTISNKNTAIVSSIVLSLHSAEVVFLMEMCSAFSKKGFNVNLLVPKFHMSTNALFDYYGVEYPFFINQVDLSDLFTKGRMAGRGFTFSIFASKILSKMNCDLIYSRSPWVFFILSVFYGKSCFLEVHQYRFKGTIQTALYRFIVKQAMKRGNGRLICISNSLMNQWAAEGIDRARIISEHDAVNLSKFTGNVSQTEAQNKIGITDHQKIVAYTGSLKAGKGVDILVQCANLLPEVTFIIVGGEQDEINQFKKEMQHGNIIFSGQVKPKYVPLYQASADILVLPNTRGSSIDDVTSPMKLFEYMATKRPIVATDMPSLLEILKDRHNALICPAGDPAGLAEKIKLLFDDTELASKIAQNAYNDLGEYTWDARVKRLVNFFNDTPESTA